MYPRFLLLFMILACLLAAPLSGATILATGSGWCSNEEGCNNTDTSVLFNHFGGQYGTTFYHNWFAFDIPNLGTITSATLSIFSHQSNSTDDPARTYTLYNATGVTYSEIVGGSILATQNVGEADTGVDHYVDIIINGTGVGLLNAAQGTRFVFGGGVDASEEDWVDIFGYTEGTPVAMLTLNGSAAVPEPATLTMLALGLAAAALLRRKRDMV